MNLKEAKKLGGTKDKSQFSSGDWLVNLSNKHVFKASDSFLRVQTLQGVYYKKATIDEIITLRVIPDLEAIEKIIQTYK